MCCSCPGTAPPPPAPPPPPSTSLRDLLLRFPRTRCFQGLREVTRRLEASRDELVAEAAAKLSERTAELKELEERAADLSSKLEVCFSSIFFRFFSFLNSTLPFSALWEPFFMYLYQRRASRFVTTTVSFSCPRWPTVDSRKTSSLRIYMQCSSRRGYA